MSHYISFLRPLTKTSVLFLNRNLQVTKLIFSFSPRPLFSFWRGIFYFHSQLSQRAGTRVVAMRIGQELESESDGGIPGGILVNVSHIGLVSSYHGCGKCMHMDVSEWGNEFYRMPVSYIETRINSPSEEGPRKHLAELPSGITCYYSESTSILAKKHRGKKGHADCDPQQWLHGSGSCRVK